jgi:hypothetical protein
MSDPAELMSGALEPERLPNINGESESVASGLADDLDGGRSAMRWVDGSYPHTASPVPAEF